MKITLISLSVLVTLSVACASHPCRDPNPTPEKTAEEIKAEEEKEKEAKKPSNSEAAKLAASKLEVLKRVWVAKPDGSKQCEGGASTSDEVRKQLKGVEIYSYKSEHDGLMRITMCGAATGQHHVFEINAKDLEKAKKAGFKEWKK